MRQRLLYVVNDVGFFLSHRRALARATSARGYEIHVAAPTHPRVEELTADGFVFHQVPLHRRRVRVWEEGLALFRLYRLYGRVRPDLVHHLTLKPILYGSIAARLSGVPAVVNAVTGLGYLFVDTAASWPRTALRHIVVRLLRQALRLPNQRVILQNPDDQALLLQYGVMSSAEAVVIKGSGVDPEAFQPCAEPSGVPVVVFASRMLRDKGVTEFVEAARQLKAQGVSCRCVLVGRPDEGNPTSISEAQLRQWVAQRSVEWWGHRVDMPRVLADATIVCLPSYYREGIPRVLIEAAAAGRPIVTTDMPGCREIVHDGQNGVLVPPRDAAAVACALAGLLADASRRAAMGSYGRALVMRDFSETQVITRTLTLYEQLLDGRASERFLTRRVVG
ncbi:MAG: glycosyltransferase family 4 protein [Deltaproteobacteria bacterium]|nr:glycosyltransferase family 4 protein [Deltaproteobacteria bacterium]